MTLTPISELLRRGKAEGGNAIDYAIVFLEDEADNLADALMGAISRGGTRTTQAGEGQVMTWAAKQ